MNGFPQHFPPLDTLDYLVLGTLGLLAFVCVTCFCLMLSLTPRRIARHLRRIFK